MTLLVSCALKKLSLTNSLQVRIQRQITTGEINKQYSLKALLTHIRPAILSTLYGYDDCIGGVNNFDTEEEYLQELKR